MADEIIQLPIDAMSHRQLDTLRGETADISAEKRQWEEEYGETEKVEAIYRLIKKIIGIKFKYGLLSECQCLITHPTNRNECRGALLDFTHIGMELILDNRMPENQYVISTKKDVEKTILSRSLRIQRKLILP